MSNPASKSHTTLFLAARWCSGIVLCGHFLTAQAVQPHELQLDLLSIQLTQQDMQSFNGLHSSEELHLETKIANTTASSFIFNKSAQLPNSPKLKKDIFWTTSIRWNYTDDGIRSSLSPRLRIESKESLIDFNPLKQTISIRWHRDI